MSWYKTLASNYHSHVAVVFAICGWLVSTHPKYIAKTFFYLCLCGRLNTVFQQKTPPPQFNMLVYLVALFPIFSIFEQEGGSLIAPMALAHLLHPIDNRSRNKRRNLWVVRWVSSWWPWFPSRSSVLIYMCIYIYIYMYVHYLYELCYRSYIQRECHSVLAKLHPITFYRGVRGNWWNVIVSARTMRFLVWMPFCVFFGLPIVSCSLIKKSNTRMFVTFGICLKQ